MGIHVKLEDYMYTPFVTEKLEARLLHLLSLHRLLETHDILTDTMAFSVRLTGLTFREGTFKTEYITEIDKELPLAEVEEAYHTMLNSIKKKMRNLRRSSVCIEISWTGRIFDQYVEGISIVRSSRSVGIKERGDIELNITYIESSKNEIPHLGEVLIRALKEGVIEYNTLHNILYTILYSEKRNGLAGMLRSNNLIQRMMMKRSTLVCISAGARPLTTPSERLAVASRSLKFIAEEIRTFLAEVLEEKKSITKDAINVLRRYENEVEDVYRIFSMFKLLFLKPHVDTAEVKKELVNRLKEYGIVASASSFIAIHHEPLDIVPIMAAVVFRKALKELIGYVNIDQIWEWRTKTLAQK